MTPDQEAQQITRAWGCGGDGGVTAMVAAVLIAERERCAKIADKLYNERGDVIAVAIRAADHQQSEDK